MISGIIGTLIVLSFFGFMGLCLFSSSGKGTVTVRVEYINCTEEEFKKAKAENRTEVISYSRGA